MALRVPDRPSPRLAPERRSGVEREAPATSRSREGVKRAFSPEDFTIQSPLARTSAGAFERKAQLALRVVLAPGFDGPKVESVRTLHAFLQQTFQHSHDVSTLTRALGGDAPTHDLDEPVALEELERRLPSLPPDTRVWLQRGIAQARREGASTVDVGKLNPYVLAGLARAHGVDEASLALHRLSPHHNGPLRPEMAADIINAIRMPRVHREYAMSFEATRAIAHDVAARNGWSVQDVALLDRAVDLQAALEKSGAITSYARRRAPK